MPLCGRRCGSRFGPCFEIPSMSVGAAGLFGGWWESLLVSRGGVPHGHVPVPVGSCVLKPVTFIALPHGGLGGASVGWVAAALMVPCRRPTTVDGWWW